MRSKRLYKSRDNKMITGVCGGVAEYLDLDPTIIRLVWTILCAVAGSGILCYIVASLIIPDRTDDENDFGKEVR
ncbi:MAG: PspC domain-containing protein [Clostridia bacterium]|nr:PspC domain-containing protein [Clostridia bacterium]